MTTENTSISKTKIAIATGGSRGLGRSTVLTFAGAESAGIAAVSRTSPLARCLLELRGRSLLLTADFGLIRILEHSSPVAR
jgi:NAD(P)-dependent dehydrogenase (short-subunit alcohol dehydrogenase family)